jgi:hypothetical protein
MAIFNEAKTSPPELLEHQYRKLFGLSAYQMAKEPVDKVVLALKIEGMINQKQEAEMKANNG